MKRQNPWWINVFSLIQILTYIKQEGGGQRKMLKGMMGGWKSWVSGGGLIIFGVTQIIQGNIEQGIQRILEGLAIIGVAHKIEKASK